MPSIRRSLLVVCLLMLTGLFTPPLRAQDALPTDLVMNAQELTADQIDTVRRYARRWAQPLLAGETLEATTIARDKLLEPLRRPSAGEAFVRAYSTVVATTLEPAPRHASPLVRLNTMVVVGQLTGPAAVQLAAQALHDENTGVRYWAAKAIAQATGSGPTLPDDLANDLTKELVGAISAENDAYTREQMSLALGGLRSPAARQAMLDMLNNRLKTYVQRGLTEDLRGEVSGLQRSQQGLIVDVIRNRASHAEVRRFVIVVAKYLQVIARAVQSEQAMDESVRPICAELIDQSEQMLNWAVKRFDPQHVGEGPELTAPFKTGQMPQFVLAVYDWIGTPNTPGLLQTTKINIPTEDVQPPAANDAD